MKHTIKNIVLMDYGVQGTSPMTCVWTEEEAEEIRSKALSLLPTHDVLRATAERIVSEAGVRTDNLQKDYNQALAQRAVRWAVYAKRWRMPEHLTITCE